MRRGKDMGRREIGGKGKKMESYWNEGEGGERIK